MDGLEEELSTLPAVPTVATPSPVAKLPAVPTHGIAIDDDDAALAALEAEMAA